MIPLIKNVFPFLKAEKRVSNINEMRKLRRKIPSQAYDHLNITSQCEQSIKAFAPSEVQNYAIFKKILIAIDGFFVKRNFCLVSYDIVDC